MKENQDQIALRKWIASGLSIEEVLNGYGDSNYLLNNMIAKYTLAADEYHVSQQALDKMHELRIDPFKTHKRSSLYGKNQPFIYEHAIPVVIIREKLKQSDKDPQTIVQILSLAGYVAILLRKEDEHINSLGFQKKMPLGWKLGDSVTARYDVANINISTTKIKMSGAIMR